MSLLRINLRPSAKDLRLFASLWLVFFSGFAVLASRHEQPVLSTGLFSLAIVVGGLGLAFPVAVRWIYVGASCATYPIGFVVSHLLLALIYFLVVTPIGLLLRLLGKDPLHRQFASEAGRASYWSGRKGSRSPASYFKQY